MAFYSFKFQYRVVEADLRQSRSGWVTTLVPQVGVPVLPALAAMGNTREAAMDELIEALLDYYSAI